MRQLLFIAPVMPDLTGSGTPMRAGVFLEALSREFDVHLLVVTMAGAASSDAVPPFVKAHTVRVVIYQGLLQGVGAALARLRDGTAPKQALAQELLDFTKVARASAQMLDRPGPARYATDDVVAAALAPIADERFDVVHVMRLYMAPFAERFLGQGSSRPTCVLDLDDHESEKSKRLSALYALTGDRASAEREADDASRYAAMEARFLPRFDRLLVCSEGDRQRLAERHRLSSVAVVPNAIRRVTTPPARPLRDEWSFLFVGAMSYFPNIDAVRFFCAEILPRIRARAGHQDATVAIVGSLAPRPLITDLSATPGVTVVGRVRNPSDYYQASTVSVVPLRAAAGTRIKLLEAFAHGTPAVSTTLGAEGLETIHDRHLLLADTADDFAEACVRLLEHADVRERLAREAGALVRTTYDFDVVAQVIRRAFDVAGRTVQVADHVADGGT